MEDLLPSQCRVRGGHTVICKADIALALEIGFKVDSGINEMIPSKSL